jgi:hypothetical protein
VVLGLVLTLILAGPLAGAGVYVLNRAAAEGASSAAFDARRRVLDADRVFRAEIGDLLRRLAERVPERAPDLRSLADDVESGVHRGVAWEESVRLDESGMDRLQQYDDLIRQRVRQLRDSPAGVSDASVRELRQALDQREDLLLLGRRAPALDPARLLRSSAPSTATVELEQIGAGDAVSYASANYVVEGIASYFAEGRTWKLVRLVPSGAASGPRWLYVGPGGLEVALLEEAAAAADAASGASETGTAVVDVLGGAGSARGVLVSYELRREGQRVALVEQWPDGGRHTYAGELVDRDELQVWPAAVRHP